MRDENLKKLVIKALAAVLERKMGKPIDVSEITGATRPIGDLGLDSPSGIGFLCDLEQLGIQVDDKYNPFVDDAKHRGRSINEIVEFLLTLPEVQQATL